MSLYEGDFETLLLQAIDEGLSSLGESSKQAIYYHLERSYHIKREEIPSRLIAFTQAIESIFGVGALLIEILIMKKLHDRIDVFSVWEDYEKIGFIEYVATARRVIKERAIIKTADELTEYESAEAKS